MSELSARLNVFLKTAVGICYLKEKGNASISHNWISNKLRSLMHMRAIPLHLNFIALDIRVTDVSV